ncbi:MAG: hypothetical protein U0271_00065 [Polyangiaceae bacterium]
MSTHLRYSSFACIGSLAVSLVACTEVIVVPGGAGGETVGSGAAPATGGAGGELFTMSSSSTGTGGEPFIGCPTIPEEDLYLVHVELADAAMTSLTLKSGCYGDEQPTARYSQGGECDLGLVMSACGVDDSGGVWQFFGTGLTDTTTTAPLLGELDEDTQFAYPFQDAEVTFDLVEPVGHMVHGTFDGMVLTPSGEVVPFRGDAALCRAPDLPPCP